MDIDKLTLVAGADIPVPELKVNIHQPTIGEIAVLGEERFYTSIGLFNISADSVVKALTSGPIKSELERIELVKSSIEALSDFELLLQVLNEESNALLSFETILMLILPEYTFSFEERIILGFDRKDPTQSIAITEENYPSLKEAVQTAFCLKSGKTEEFNPGDDRARDIAEKLERAREKVRNLKGQSKEKTYILANYISSLGIGSNALNILNAVDLTVYQLFNQMERYGLFIQNEYALKAAMAGAKNVEMIDWLKNI